MFLVLWLVIRIKFERVYIPNTNGVMQSCIFLELHFTYHLSGAGWADATIYNGNIRHDITVSYLHDSLLELSSGVDQILNGEKSSVEIHFMDEPGEHKLVLTTLGDKDLLMELFWSDDWVDWSKKSSSTYKLILSTITTKIHFANLTLSILENLLERHGEGGYKELWIEHPFPAKEYKKLKLHLA